MAHTETWKDQLEYEHPTITRIQALHAADRVIAILATCIPPYKHLSRYLIADAIQGKA